MAGGAKHMPKKTTYQRPPLQQAVAKAGGLRALARQLHITHVAIMQWERVPPPHVMRIEKLTGVARSVLRPDIYPPEREQR
jgi:DNA-binding transcriptional regulator YdaS (Cro superfamily)